MTRIPQATESLSFYEGLIFKTAQMTAPLVEDDLQDVQQVLRIKVWMALKAFDPARGYPRERWVFMLMRNQVKDILKKKRRGDLCLDAVRNMASDEDGGFVGDSFDEQYLAVDADAVFAEVERELPLIPSTLTDLELRVVCLLYGDFKHGEVALALSVTKRDVERLVRSVRLKMADWKPEAGTPALEMLPQVETLRAA